MIIDELRQQFPEIASLDTEEIVDYAHKRVAPDMDYNEFSRKLGYEPSVVKRTLKGVVSGAENMLIKGTVAGLGTYYQAQGEKANEPEKDLSYRVGTKMVDWAKSYKPMFEPSTTEAQTFSSKLGTGAGSLVAFIGAAPAGVMGQFGMIYGNHYLQIDAERPEWTEDKKREYAVIQGAIETALEKAGTSYIIDPFTKVGKALTGQVLKKSALWGIAKSSMEGFLSESTQEGIQQIGNNVIDKAYKIDRNLMDGVFESALIGGILGGSVRGFGTSLLSISQKDQLKAVGLDNKDIDALSKDMGEVIDNTIKENPDAVKEASDILKEGISKDSTGQVKQSLIDNGVSEDDANSLVENMIPEDIEELVELETEETLDAYETEKANRIQQLVDEGTPMDVAEQSMELLDKAMDSFAKLQNKTKVDVLKNIVLQRGKASDVADGALKQDDSLIAIHNLSEENLFNVDKIGGLAVPSLAITKADAPLEGFGEITLIASQEMIEPDRETKVFGADIYSPRYPSLTYRFDYDAYNDLQDKVSMSIGESAYLGDIERGGIRSLLDSRDFQLYFMDKNGLLKEKVIYDDGSGLNKYGTLEKNNFTKNDAFREFAQQEYNKLNVDEKIFKGFTPSGNRKYVEHNLDNVVKEIKKDLRSGENFNYGVGSIRATVAKQYKTLSSIKKDRSKIISKDKFEEIKLESDDLFESILEDASKANPNGNSFNFADIVVDGVKNNSLWSDLKEFGYGDMDTSKLKLFLNTIADMPTEYFEVKITRGVGIGEFDIALIPYNTGQKARNILSKSGIEIVEYDERKETRRDVLNKIKKEKPNLFFQEAKGSYQRIDGKDVITLFETADASTLVHEMAHMFLTWSMETGVDLSRVKKFAGVKDITPRNIRNVQEKFARGFEAYLREGKAPDAEMKSVFDNFKEWLGEIYKSIKELNIKLTPEITSFFDDMITGKLVDTTSVKQNIAVDNKAKYENNEKYHKIIPEVKSIDVNKIKPLNGMETQSVSSEVANNMDFSEPINVSVFSDGEIMVTDGHHRLASAKQLGMKEINVVLQAINAKGKTINNLINAQQATEKKLTGIELFQKAIEEIDNKRKELLERLAKGREKAIEARRKKKEYIDDIKEIQKELTDFIQGLDLEAKDKAKFIGRIAKTTTRRTLARQVMEISERATDLKSQELKREYKKQIAKELKATKDVKQGTKTVGKYDYETNKLFTDLRRYNKMSKAQALDAQIDKADPTPYERIAISFLDYKANGVESSVQLMEQVYNDITLAKELGSQAKSEDELENKINRYEKRKEIAESLTANKMTKNAITRAIASGYAKGFGNIQSIIGAIMNKKLADELNMEILESNRDTQFYNTTKTMASLGSEILGVDTKDFVNEMDKMSNKEFSIKDKDGLVKELDVMQLLHIYLGIKNDKVRDAYNFHYALDEGMAEIQLGENNYTLTTQVAQLLSNLSTEQIEFADMLQSTVQSYYGKVNEVHIRNTGKDLGRVENYFPMKSEFEQDFIDDIKQVGETPSYAKERSAGLALPDPQNAWNMATKHIAQAEHQTTISERYVELKRILNSNQRIELENGDTVTIKKLIQDLYGKDMFTTMNDALDDLSLGAYSKSLDAVSKMFGRALNNWVVAKIALNPSVFVKQLISIGNYQEDMKFTEWNKYFVEGMSDPVKTWKYMMDISPYLRSRLDTGYNEALQRVMDDSQKLSKMKNSWVKALTSMTRYGDITAIIYGGYPLIQKQLAEGKTIEQAEEAFRQATIRSQQSGLSSSRSRFQNQNNPIARMFLAFKNTPTQYLRKLVDAQIQLANNEITKEQYAKTMTIYAVIQPALFAFSGVAMKSLLYGDDFSDLFSDMMEAIATSPFNAIPVISDIIKYGYRKATGQKVWNVLSTPMLDDIESLVKSMGDSDVSISDILSELAYVGEIATGIPFKTGERIIKRNIDRFAN